mgnify:CR=1 FL=1
MGTAIRNHLMMKDMKAGKGPILMRTHEAMAAINKDFGFYPGCGEQGGVSGAGAVRGRRRARARRAMAETDPERKVQLYARLAEVHAKDLDDLDGAIQALREGREPELEKPLQAGCELDLQLPALLPEDYIPDVHLRLQLYKRMAGAADDAGLDDLQSEMIDRFGPLPRAWLHYRGLYRSGERVVISYAVGGTAILESHDLEALSGQPVFVRTLNIAKSSRDLTVRVGNAGTAVAVSGSPAVTTAVAGRFVTLRIPAAATPLRLAVRLAKSPLPGLACGSRPTPRCGSRR